MDTLYFLGSNNVHECPNLLVDDKVTHPNGDHPDPLERKDFHGRRSLKRPDTKWEGALQIAHTCEAAVTDMWEMHDGLLTLVTKRSR
ncbi:hypothetical protein NPIL_267391 [Nephila pilipes]|uniref:Uncharacterized protein n=1 Tax=Nephila pilipes TaxID=299642 RepID=A0A8X6MPX3_NEPPI|nr:hypothetical protein NPIL_267391 [Nephila pilipes]